MNKIWFIALSALFSVAPIFGEILTNIPVTEQALFDYSLKRTVDYTIDFGFSESTNTPVREGDRAWGLLDFATPYAYKPTSGAALLKTVCDSIRVEAQKALYMNPVKTNVLLCARAVTDDSNGYSMLWINYYFQVKQYPSGKFYVPSPTTNDLVIVYGLFRFRFDNIDYATYTSPHSQVWDSRNTNDNLSISVKENQFSLRTDFLIDSAPGSFLTIHTRNGKDYTYDMRTGRMIDTPIVRIQNAGVNEYTGSHYLWVLVSAINDRNFVLESSTDFIHWETVPSPEWEIPDYFFEVLTNTFFRARYTQ